MEQKEIVHDFVETLGKISPPIINADLLKNYITNIVVDSESLEEFIAYTDRFSKHTQTFQMSMLIHSLASTLVWSPLGNPVKQVHSMIPNNCIQIPHQTITRFAGLPASKRYEDFCRKLMDCDTPECQSLETRIDNDRLNLEKLDDGTKEKNPCFDPMKTSFPQSNEPTGTDLTDELEIND